MKAFLLLNIQQRQNVFVQHFVTLTFCNVRLHSVSTAAYSWWSSAYVVSFLTEEMGSLNLFGNCQWTSTIIRTTKKQCIKILKECCGSNFSFPLSATNRAGWSIGPICHHRHLIHDTFKRQIPDDFTNHYTDNEPAVLQELPVMLLHPLEFQKISF